LKLGLSKRRRLLALAKLRQVTRWPDYKPIADYRDGVYECDFVSPFTKGAGNVNAEVMVLLQDWSSHDELNRGLDEETVRLGYSPTQPTSRNLERLLKTTFGLSLSDIYGTNLCPFVKRGGVSGQIPTRDLIRAAREFALPQIEIVRPRLVICLGLVTFDALRCATGLPCAGKIALAISSPFQVGDSRVWCQAHTGAWGQMNRNKGGVDRVSQDWMRMKEEWRIIG
jgi:hypothetical protein